MAYRAVKINWLPRTQAQWAIFTAARLEAGKLWSDLVEHHLNIRKSNVKWPTKYELVNVFKNKYKNLHSQSVQQIIFDFCDTLNAITQQRKNDNRAKYPWRKPKYYDVTFTNQGARIRNDRLMLPCGNAGTMSIKLPDIKFEGRLMEVRLKFGEFILTFVIENVKHKESEIIGIDLGVNTLIAATNERKAVLVSGRDIKSTVQWRNKKLAGIVSKQSNKMKNSKRWRLLQKRKHKMLKKAHNRVNDIIHKATRKIADIFPNTRAYVGEPFNNAAKKMIKKTAQLVSQACNRKIINLLNYKLFAAIIVPEAYSSQTCPVCGERNKCRRVYRCRCGCVAPRDVIGAINIRCIGIENTLIPGRRVPNTIQWIRPTKYPGINPGSSSGHEACSSFGNRREAI